MNKSLLVSTFVLILINFTSLFSQNEMINEFANIKMETYQQKSKIDNCLLKYLKNELSTKFTIANPNKKYNATDVIFYPSKPSRSLIFTSCNTEQDKGLIFYKSGFIGRPYLCLLYKKNDKKGYEITLLGVSSRIVDLKMLQDEIQKKNYSIMRKGSI